MSDSPQRRNPLRLIVSKETQLRILWLVGGGIFICILGTLVLSAWIGDWLWTVILMLALGSFISLWVSRRIAGPFYRIEQDLEALLDGATTGREIRLRPGDPLHHLASLLNELIERTGKGELLARPLTAKGIEEK